MSPSLTRLPVVLGKQITIIRMKSNKALRFPAGSPKLSLD